MFDNLKIVKTKGFKETFSILATCNNYEISKTEFFKKLNENSYYNAFYRVKEDFFNKGLMEIEEKNNEIYYKLTTKGVLIKNKLEVLEKLIGDKSGKY